MPLFSKPPLTISEQLQKLKDRGLVIPDEIRARHYLSYVGYYHLSAYGLSFQQSATASIDGLPDKPFKPGINFEDILNLYIFDRELRLLVMDAIERIEIAFRSCVVNEMCLRHGAHWYMQSNLFDSWFRHPEFIEELEKEYKIKRDSQGNPLIGAQHHETFINHYFTNYSAPYLPPAWMVAETLSLGKLSRIFSNIKDANLRKIIAGHFGVDEHFLQKFMHSISYMRNLCAHHARLWNRRFVIKPVTFKRQQEMGLSNQYISAQFIILHDLLKFIAPDSSWDLKLEALFRKHQPDWNQMGSSGISLADFFAKLRTVKP